MRPPPMPASMRVGLPTTKCQHVVLASLLLLWLLACNVQTEQPPPSHNDKKVLLEFKASVLQCDQTALPGWGGNDVSMWEGVNLNEQNEVTGIFLYEQSLCGGLPVSFAKLGALQYLDLTNTNMSGSLPPLWGNMSSLEILDLRSTRVSGSLPPQWANMRSLERLDLGDTSVSGSLPPQWGNMSSLIYLDLSNTNVSGPLPPTWGNMSRLERLEISNTSVSGSLPPQWSNMSSLERLVLGDTRLSGTLAAQWSKWSSLETLHLYNTSVSGPLPPQWNKWSSLGELHLGNTNVSGSLPPQWGNMSNLYHLVLMDTSVSGTLPPQWSSSSSLMSLDLRYTNLSGPLPPQWSNMSSMSFLLLGNSNVSGPLPPQWSNWSTLLDLDLSNTKLSGPLPPQWGNWSSLERLVLSNTSVSGLLPPQWGNMTNMESLDLYNTSVSGPLPPQWSNLTSLWSLRLGMNHLTGTIPPSFRQLKLTFIDVASNRLSGSLPAFPATVQFFNASANMLNGSIPDLPASLQYCDLNNNQLSGQVPKLLPNSSMVYMSLNDNQLDALPSAIQAPNTTFLSVARNRLQGTLPSGPQYNHSLLYCDLSGNQLTGVLPGPSWSEHTAWLYLALDGNALSGSLPTVWQGNVSVLLLQNNSISGCLPDAWPNNGSLTVLAVSANNLSCTTGLPRHWGTNNAFSNMSVLAMGNNSGLLAGIQLPTEWFDAASFNKASVLLFGNMWTSSARNRKWRKKVCIQPDLNARLVSQLDKGVSQTVTDALKQALESGLAGLTRTLLELNVTDVRFDLGPVDLRLGDTTQPSQDKICGNESALMLVVALWSAVGAAVLVLVALFAVEKRWRALSACYDRAAACCCRSSHMPYGTAHNTVMDPEGGPPGAGAHGHVLFPRFSAMSCSQGTGGPSLRYLISLLMYWYDIILDVVLLKQVLDVGASLGYVLLAILVAHYILAACLVAWRWLDGKERSVGSLVLRPLAALLLVPAMPIIDTCTFIVLTCNACGWNLQCVGGMNVEVESERWQRFFEMRDTWEVVMEAIPTTVIQTVVFVVGNTPRLGVYLDTRLYVLSMVGGCFQMLRLMCVVLWVAAQDSVSPVKVLWNMVTWRGHLERPPGEAT